MMVQLLEASMHWLRCNGNSCDIINTLALSEHHHFPFKLIKYTVIQLTISIFQSFQFGHTKRHQYEAYKQQLVRSNAIPRERSPRARRFFHRRQTRDFDHNNGRNGGDGGGGIRNDRGGRRRRRPNENVTKESNQEQNIENSENKQKTRRRNYNRNRKSKNNNAAGADAIDQNQDDQKPDQSLQLTESNLTTLLSELNMSNIGNKSLNTANSTSSESLDFEKINTEDTNMCSSVTMASASSRLAASFNKGN